MCSPTGRLLSDQVQGQLLNRAPGPTIPGPKTDSQAQWINDRLISIGDIRSLFKLGRTAAYELTHRCPRSFEMTM